MPRLLDYEAFCEDLKEVTVSKIMAKKKFHPNGLFSEQIFGPVRNFTCQCGTYYGVFYDGVECSDCGVDIVNSSERRRRFAKIVLPFPVVNPVFYDLLVDQGGNMLKGAIDQLMKDEKSVLYYDPEEEEFSVTEDGNVPEGLESWDRLDAIEKLVTSLATDMNRDRIQGWDIIYNNLDKLFTNKIIVLPPDLRPSTRRGGKTNQVVDEINRYYVQILTKKEIMKDTVVDILRDKALFYNFFKQLQRDVNELYNHILAKLSKKEGLIRGNILGKRTDFSGRAVITPDPTLRMDECVLPYVMVLELFKLQIAKKLVEINKFKLINEGIDFVDDCIEYVNPILYKICEDLIKDEVCLLNRQPSLHRLSMLGFNIKISMDSVIKIHPMICPPYNADFDGDQMAVYIPITEEAKQEVRDKLFVTKNFTNPANGSLTTTPSQDIILGIYALTKNMFPELSEMVSYKGEAISESMKEFNECFPDDYPLINRVVTGKDLIKILNDVKDRYSDDMVAEILDAIKRIGFKYSSLFGCTMSLGNFFIHGGAEIRDNIYEESDVHDQLAGISGDETTSLLKENFKYSYMIESGARGSWDQARQIVFSRGFISNFKGHILETPIKHCLLEGLTQKEFFNSTYGCRKGLLDVALNTGASGYLSRKLIFSCANLQIGDCEDCGSTDTLKCYVNDKKKAAMLIGKYHVNGGNLELITYENHESFMGQTLQLRSPIFCKEEKVCHVCYGELRKEINTRFIGIVAAQSLGECNTQLVLRTFHTSGVAVLSDQAEDDDMKQMDIVNDLSVASKLLHQFKNVDMPDLVNNLYDVYNRSRTILHVHFECIVAQLMWTGFTKWRLHDDREKKNFKFHSVQTVPSYESWLLALAFSNPKRSILKGIMYSGHYSGVMDQILMGSRIE